MAGLTTADARRLLVLPEDQRRVTYIPSDREVTGVITAVGRLFIFVRWDDRADAEEACACDPANLQLVDLTVKVRAGQSVCGGH